MDNAGDWLYIVFLIIAGISSLFGSKNKKTSETDIGATDREIVTNEDNVPDKGFWEILEEMQNPKPAKQPVPTPKRKRNNNKLQTPHHFLPPKK